LIAVHDDVVHVEQQVAVGALEHRGDEFRLGHFRSGLRVIGHVLQRDAHAQLILNDADTLGDMAHRVLGEGNRHQVVEVAELVPAGGEVLGVVADAVGAQESAQIPQEVAVQGARPTDVQGQAVADEGLGLGPLAEGAAEGAPEVHPVLGGDFEEIHLVAGAGVLCERAQKSPPQTQSRAAHRIDTAWDSPHNHGHSAADDENPPPRLRGRLPSPPYSLSARIFSAAAARRTCLRILVDGFRGTPAATLTATALGRLLFCGAPTRPSPQLPSAAFSSAAAPPQRPSPQLPWATFCNVEDWVTW
jgi:hypothetical protein